MCIRDSASGGVLYEYGNEYIVRGVLQSADVKEIGKAVIKKVGESPTPVSYTHLDVYKRQTQYFPFFV